MDARTFTTTDYQWMMTGTSFVNYSTGEIKRSESCRLHHWGWLGKSSWFDKVRSKQDQRDTQFFECAAVICGHFRSF